MPMTRLAIADAFGAATIALVALTAIIGLLSIYRCLYFQLQIRRRGFSHLSYFNGPWIIRIILIIISIWWGFGEIVRLSFLRGAGRPLTSTTWQRYGCKFYVLSNLGFAEPIIFLMLGFLLHASLQKSESDSLTHRWNWKTFIYVILLCLPLFIFQILLMLLAPKYNEEEMHRMMRKKKMAKFLLSSSSLANNMIICTYPLLSTIILGLFDLSVIVYVVYSGARMLCLVINKGLRLRVYFLALSVIFFLPLRVMLLGFSVLPLAGNMAYEVLVFAAFVMLLSCNMIGICMLVYLPVADSLALRQHDQNGVEIDEMIPCDDYHGEGTWLIGNLNRQGSGRNSDARTTAKRGLMSLCALIEDNSPPVVCNGGVADERSSIAFSPLHVVSSVESPPYREEGSPVL